jgi:hypothetical protein
MARKNTDKIKLNEMVEQKDDVVTEDQHSDNVASIAMKPTTKMAAISAAVNLLGMLDKDSAINALDQMIAGIGHEDDGIPDSDSGHNKGTIGTHPSNASAAMKESVAEAIQEIFGDDKELSTEFKEKTTTLFEAALSARIVIERESIREEVEAESEEFLNGLVEQVNEYISYVAEEFLKENQVAVESTLRSEITEDLLIDLKSVFENHYIDIPEEKVDVVETLTATVADLEEKLNASMEENIEYRSALVDHEKQEVIDAVAEGLVLTQREKFLTLIEDIDYNPDNYEQKLSVIKDKYLLKKPSSSRTGVLNEDVEDPDPDDIVKTLDPQMSQYITVMNKVVAKNKNS